MKSVKIVFLDFDGVLNSTAYMLRLSPDRRGGLMGLDPEAVARVNRLLAETGAEVVVSSSWRHGHSRTELCDILHAAGFVGTVRGKTPDCVPNMHPLSKRHVGERGDEIQVWLDENRERLTVESFVILDDDADMAHLAHKLVKTEFATGLLDEHVDRAVAMLREPA